MSVPCHRVLCAHAASICKLYMRLPVSLSLFYLQRLMSVWLQLRLPFHWLCCASFLVATAHVYVRMGVCLCLCACRYICVLSRGPTGAQYTKSCSPSFISSTLTDRVLTGRVLQAMQIHATKMHPRVAQTCAVAEALRRLQVLCIGFNSFSHAAGSLWCCLQLTLPRRLQSISRSLLS